MLLGGAEYPPVGITRQTGHTLEDLLQVGIPADVLLSGSVR